MKKLFSTILISYCFLAVKSQATLPFEDNFNIGDFNPAWTLNANLEGTGGFISVYNNIGLNGSFGAIIGKTFDENAFTTNALDLNLDLSNETEVELTFWIADYYDETHVKDGIYFSDNGGSSFTKVLNFYPEEWCDVTYGQHPPIDVDELAALAGLNLTSQFVIRFQQTGLTDFNGTYDYADGFYIDDVKVYNPGLTYATLPFEDNFNSGSLGNSWAWNFADETVTINTGSAITGPMNYVGVVNATGPDNTHAVLMGRRCDGTFITNALDLHLDLSNESNVEMTFWIADYYDETQVDDGIYFSDNGGETFVKAIDFFPSEWCDVTYGQHPPIDVDKLAELAGLNLTSQFVIRFQQTGSTDFNGTYDYADGLYLDNVKVYEPELEYATIPFEDDFNTGAFKNAWTWSFADSTVSISTNYSVTSPMNFVGIVDQTGADGTYAIKMGRRCDGNYTTNALDLHLNLLGESDVEMTFWIADYYDETQVDDGIYFSDNGGVSFVKALDFLPSAWCDVVYGQHPPIDIDKLAHQKGLNLTDNFVIRFQQTGTSDFNGTYNYSDGFFIDDVKVYDPNLQYATLPFVDNFETGNFKSAWAWNFADSTANIEPDEILTSPMNLIKVANGYGNNGSTYGVLIGKRCDGLYATNALDLHLDLTEQKEIQLNFWLAHNFENIQVDDGIYFSDNGGESFEMVHTFDFTNSAAGVYENYQLDLSTLATEAGLVTSDSFVVRFQQTGPSDFSGTYDYADGLFLDDVNVIGISTASIEDYTLADRIKIYPNPFSEEFFIDLSEVNARISHLMLKDVLGRIILEKKQLTESSTSKIEVNELPEGIYILTIKTQKGETLSTKIIKRK